MKKKPSWWSVIWLLYGTIAAGLPFWKTEMSLSFANFLYFCRRLLRSWNNQIIDIYEIFIIYNYRSGYGM